MAAINIEHGVRPQVLGKNGTNYIYQKDDPGLDTTNISYSFPYTVMNFEIKIPDSNGTSGSGGRITGNPVARVYETDTTEIAARIYPDGTQLLTCITEFTVAWPNGTIQKGTFNPHASYAPTRCAHVIRVDVTAWQTSSGTFSTTTNANGVTDNTHYTAKLIYTTWEAWDDFEGHIWEYVESEPKEKTWSVPALTYSSSGSFGGHYKTKNEDLKIFDLTMVET